MLSRTIAAICIIDDALQAMGHKDDPQTKVPSSVILTLAILAAMELGGKHNKALALAKDLNLFTHVPSPSGQVAIFVGFSSAAQSRPMSR